MAVKKFDLKQAKKLLPKKTKYQNKTAGGKTLVIAGSPGFLGAAILSATAAARVGSGYTLLYSPSFSKNISADFLTINPLRFSLNKVKMNSVAIGPGLGINQKTYLLLKQLIKLNGLPVVADADALSVIAKKNIYPLPDCWVLTPHMGELSRLLGVSTKNILLDPKVYLVQAQKKYGCVVLLKGHKSLVCDAKLIYQILAGNSALAKAGTGDVLTGMIAGFLAQGLSPCSATCLGAFVHGYAADYWIKMKKDHLSLLATDLLNLLPVCLSKIRSS